MIIGLNIIDVLKKVKGIIHIGAHECEERETYLEYFTITDEDIIWIDAFDKKVFEIKEKYPSIKIYNECISDKDNITVIFNVTDNYKSSSFLKLKEHLIEYPEINVIYEIEMKTKSLKTFYNENNFMYDDYNLMVLNIQGAELLALKGAEEVLNYVDYIYTKVTVNELYENCSFLEDFDKYLKKFNFKRFDVSLKPNGYGEALYVKNVHKLNTNYVIEYGTYDHRIDISDFELKNNLFHIPKNDEVRALLFGDPVFGKVKNIYISDEKNNYIINQDIFLNISNNILYINRNEIKKLCIMAIFKNETMNLKLWVEHYLWQGVEHFYLIDNGSTDEPLKILQEYIDNSIVTYYYRPEKFQQVQHYRYVFDNENLKYVTKWLCICDLDEFFFGTNNILKNTLDDYDCYDVIYTNSHFYGSDNLKEHPKDIRCSIIYREEDIANGTKYIFKPSSINNSSEIWIHWLVDENTLIRKNMKEIWNMTNIRLNHYRIQSLEYFTNVKMTRGDVSLESNENIRDLKYFEHYTRASTIKDDILKQIIETGNNYNKKPICIHKYITESKINTYPQGFGDFIRGTIALYYYSKKYNYQLYIDNSHPVFKFLLENSLIIENKNFTEIIELICPPFSYEYIDHKLHSLFLNNKSFCVMTNSFYTKSQYGNFENFGDISSDCKDFFKKFLIPNEYLKTHINKIFNELGLVQGDEYNVIHLRLGDRFLIDNNGYNINDYDKQLFDKLNYTIKNTLINNKTQKFILVTDSSEIGIKLKENNPELYYWNNTKIHIGAINTYNDPNIIIDTLIDFFIITQTKNIYAYSDGERSGFSKIISIIFDINYFTLYI